MGVQIISVYEADDSALLQCGPESAETGHFPLLADADRVVTDPPLLSSELVSEIRWEVLANRFHNAWESKWEHLGDIGWMVGGGIAGGLLLTLLFVPVCGAAAPLCAGGVMVGGGGGYWLYQTVDNNLRASHWMGIGQKIGSLQTVKQGAQIWTDGLIGDVKGAAVVAAGVGATHFGGPRLAQWWRARSLESGVEVLQRRPAALLGERLSRSDLIDLTEVDGRWVYKGSSRRVRIPQPFPTVGEWGYQRPLFAMGPAGWNVMVPARTAPPFAAETEVFLFAGGGHAIFTPRPKTPRLAAENNKGTGKEIDTLVSKRLGNYFVLEKLATGGMADVYEGYHWKFKKRVAIKVIKSPYARDPQFRERFMREAQSTRRAAHEHIVEYIGVDWDEPTKKLYLVVEYLRGETLEETLEGQPMSWNRARDILLQITEGLEAVHRAGLVHRDLKPGNIMLTRTANRKDFVKILDLGIAKPFAVLSPKLTEEGLTIGTPEYMSPEQVQGEDPDHRSDLYSLGVIMYEMLTGRLPFEGKTPDSIRIKHVTHKPPRPRRFLPTMPEEIETIILRALAKNPVERFSDVKEMARAIEAVAPDVPVRSRTSEFFEKMARAVRAVTTRGRKAARPVSLGQTEKTPILPAEIVEEGSPPAKASDAAERFSDQSQTLKVKAWHPFSWKWTVTSLLALVLGGGLWLWNRRGDMGKDGEEEPTTAPPRWKKTGAKGGPEPKKPQPPVKVGVEEKEPTVKKEETSGEAKPAPNAKPRATGTAKKAEKRERVSEAPKARAEEKTEVPKTPPAPPSPTARLINDLKNGDVSARRLAAVTLGKNREISAVPSLVGALKSDENGIVRKEAAFALGLIEDRSALEPLIEALRTDTFSGVREKAAEALGKIGDKRASQALIHAAKEDPNRLVQFVAAKALEKIEK